MDAIAHLPVNTEFKPPLEGHYLAPVYAGEVMIMLIDLRYVSFTLPPVEPPPPPPDPTPVETELYVVVNESRLNVREDHALGKKIIRRLSPGEEFVLIIGEFFDDTDNDILWRKLLDGGWVAVSRGDDVYAKAVDTSVRGG